MRQVGAPAARETWRETSKLLVGRGNTFDFLAGQT